MIKSFPDGLAGIIAEIDAGERKRGKFCKVEASQVKVT
jgi:hypothetical protein